MSEQQATGPVHIRTLGDLGDRFWLGVLCTACNNWRDLDRRELVARLGADIDLDEINRRLRCSQCGSRETLLYRGFDAGGYAYGSQADT